MRGLREIAAGVGVEDLLVLLDQIAQYEDSYRLCFLRGPEGIIIGLAEQLS